MIGVVADDVTGANDIGIMFTNGGYIADVYSFDQDLDLSFGQPEVLIIDTDSRLDSAEKAYNKVYQATKKLKSLGCTLFINKTCSVFRGNIGPEFDAMLDALGEEFAVVVLGFPKNGRRTIDGIHYVHGEKLENSPFRHDPVHPMTRSDLVGILQSQTSRIVSGINWEAVTQGADHLRCQIEQKKNQCNYLVLDVVDQSSLKVIAGAVKDQFVLCGSSALGEELPEVLGNQQTTAKHLAFPRHEGKGVLCIAGSLTPQTKMQIEYGKGVGIDVLELDTIDMFNRNEGFSILDLVQKAVDLLKQGKDVIIHSTNTTVGVSQTKEIGQSKGLTNTDVSRLISRTLAKIAQLCVEQSHLNRFVIAGGDTSAAVVKRLEIGGMRVWQEIEPGLPSCYSLERHPKLFVLKSGSFGQPDFLVKAMSHLKKY